MSKSEADMQATKGYAPDDASISSVSALIIHFLTQALRSAILCTSSQFARPQHLRQPAPLLMQPLSARRMRVLLRFRMGAHSLPVVLGRRFGAPRAQRLCQWCDQDAIGTNAMVVECPALLWVRDKYAALLAHGACIMQHFMWQVIITAVADCIKDCFAVLDAPV